MLTLGLLLAVAVQATPATSPPAPVARTISGIVLDEHGAPLSGALVQWQIQRAAGAKTLARTTSMEGGRFDLPLATDEKLDWYENTFLSVQATGLAPSLVDLMSFDDGDLHIGPVHVYPFAELQGRVTSLDGAPIAGAVIRAETATVEPIATTGSDGSFSCSALPAGPVRLGVSAAGFAEVILEPRTFELHAINRLDVALRPGRSVTISVRSKKTGEPVAATCRFFPPGSSKASYGALPRFSDNISQWHDVMPVDSSGQLEIRDVAIDGGGGVGISAEGYKFTYLALDGTDATVELEPTSWIDVRARRDGSGEGLQIRDVAIGAGAAFGQVPDGSYTSVHDATSGDVRQLTPDHWRIEWGPDTFWLLNANPVRVVVTLADGGLQQAELTTPDANGDQAAVLDFSPTTRIRGRVRSSEGEPVRLKLAVENHELDDVRQVVHSPKAPPALQFETDAEGRFDLPNVGVTRGRFVVDTPGWELTGNGVTFVVEPNANAEHTLTVAPKTIDRDRVVLRGVVRVKGSAPRIPLELVLAWDSSADEITIDTTWSDVDGNFQFVTPRMDEYLLIAHRTVPKMVSRRTAYDFSQVLDTSSAWIPGAAGALMEGVQVDLPPFDEWTVPPTEKR